MSSILIRTEIDKFPCRRGKVRDVYDIGDDTLVIVTTDRISAYDCILPTPIPEKGRILTQLTTFWLDFLKIENHLISTNLKDMPEPFQNDLFDGRTMLVHKALPIPFECVVRGYLCGSGWNDYKKTGSICGNDLPANLQENMAFPKPIFTPATKAENGHDLNVNIDDMMSKIGKGIAFTLKMMSKTVYEKAAQYAWNRGIIIADTKFEWGQMPDGRIILIDEVLTPDSSRFWDVRDYCLSISPQSLDKQFVRNYLTRTRWDRESEPPDLPQEIVERTQEKYQQIHDRLVKPDSAKEICCNVK